MTADERKRMLAAIFDTITASAEGVNRLEPCEDWAALRRRGDPQAGEGAIGC